jgi:hypothetical protein
MRRLTASTGSLVHEIWYKPGLQHKETDRRTDNGTGLFPLTLPGSVGAVDVVEAANSALHAEILGVMLAELLSSQLLKTVSILGLKTTPPLSAPTTSHSHQPTNLPHQPINPFQTKNHHSCEVSSLQFNKVTAALIHAIVLVLMTYQSRPSIRFLQAGDIRLQLLEFRIDTRAWRIEEPSTTKTPIHLNKTNPPKRENTKLNPKGKTHQNKTKH